MKLKKVLKSVVALWVQIKFSKIFDYISAWVFVSLRMICIPGQDLPGTKKLKEYTASPIYKWLCAKLGLVTTFSLIKKYICNNSFHKSSFSYKPKLSELYSSWKLYI